MDKIFCFDTSIGTPNVGDYIIAESCERELAFLLDGSFVIKYPTHTPLSHWYQNFRKTALGGSLGDVRYKFVFGTNLINRNMLVPTPLWNINALDTRIARGAICIGVGLGSSDEKPNLYTRALLKKALNSNYAHSARDEKTAAFLRGLGVSAINTGCATTWRLTNEHCSEIPTEKSDSVIFTLTDYKKDPESDQLLIDTLQKCYKRISFWVQGAGDFEYLHTFRNIEGIEIIAPTLRAYTEALSGDVDFVGTRLHAGIKAMQCKKRAIIIEVDNRATDMKGSINLPSLGRSELQSRLEEMIFSSFETRLNINEEAIRSWKEQFV
ncbi:MAG: polysaccharide pyruvyl transferase family protein [Clostridia bacterium]|nr:polysaccharide pyruvyl transferase family protein [Clostridia bacterium]